MNERLAEIRKRGDPNTIVGYWYHHDVALADVRYLLAHIDQLEQLMPDDDLLGRVYGALKLSGATRLALRFGTLGYHIRKYRRTENGH